MANKKNNILIEKNNKLITDDIVTRKRGRPKGSKNTVKTTRPDKNPYNGNSQGDNTKILRYSLELSRLPSIDVNDIEQVKQRVNEFFTISELHDMKPAIASLALSFGINRVTLFNWLTEKTNTVKNPECLNAIKNAYDIINSQYEIYMNNGKINPVAGIFLMKNNMGYKDTTDHVITTSNENQDSINDISNRANLLEE